MPEEKVSIFRQKNVEAIQSPEALNDYLRVTSPKIWIVLAAIIAVLIGTVIWGIFGSIDTRVPVAVVFDGQQGYIVAPYEELDAILDCNCVQVGEETYTLTSGISEPVSISEDVDVRIRLAGELEVGDVVSAVQLAGNHADGIYSGEAVTEHLRPMSLLLR